MTLVPANARGRWLLLLFPFKAYLFLAPISFTAWELITSGHRIRGGRAEAMGMVGLGYFLCFAVFIFAAICFAFARKFDGFFKAALFAFLAFYCPPLIYQEGGFPVATIAVCLIGIRFAPTRNLFKTSQHSDKAPCTCLACGTAIPSGTTKCRDCGWTYLT